MGDGWAGRAAQRELQQHWQWMPLSKITASLHKSTFAPNLRDTAGQQ